MTEPHEPTPMNQRRAGEPEPRNVRTHTRTAIVGAMELVKQTPLRVSPPEAAAVLDDAEWCRLSDLHNELTEWFTAADSVRATASPPAPLHQRLQDHP